MQNRSIDVPARLKRLDKKVRKWLIMMMEGRDDTIARHEESLRQYLADESEVIHLDSYLSCLRHDHLVRFEHAALNEGTLRWELLALSSRYALANLLVEAIRAKDFILLTKAALYMTLPVMAGWQEVNRVLFQVIRSGIDTPLLNLRGTNSSTQFYFLLLLAADFHGQPIEVARYRFPKPEDMTAYMAALQHWRSPDLDLVQRLVTDMADYHVTSGQGDFSPFGGHIEYLFPYEILAFLRFRQWAGLPNPASFDHPLMNTPLAVLPPDPLPWPEIPLLDQVIAKFKTAYPEHHYFDQLPTPRPPKTP